MATPAVTHDLTIGDMVKKRYRSWDRDEHRREWTALCLLAQHAPDLAPRPIRAQLEGDPPVIVMSRLQGETPRQVDTDSTEAIAAAVTRLHHAVPAAAIEALPPRGFHPSTSVAQMQTAFAAEPPPLDSTVSEAYAAARLWLASSAARDLASARPPAALGRGDGNLANNLVEGSVCRLVDFEDSGVSDHAFEIADVVEHISVWRDAPAGSDLLIDAFKLTTAERNRLEQARRLMAIFWLRLLMPDGPAHGRNPPGTLEQQATRLLALL